MLLPGEVSARRERGEKSAAVVVGRGNGAGKTPEASQSAQGPNVKFSQIRQGGPASPALSGRKDYKYM